MTNRGSACRVPGIHGPGGSPTPATRQPHRACAHCSSAPARALGQPAAAHAGGARRRGLALVRRGRRRRAAVLLRPRRPARTAVSGAYRRCRHAASLADTPSPPTDAVLLVYRSAAHASAAYAVWVACARERVDAPLAASVADPVAVGDGPRPRRVSGLAQGNGRGVVAIAQAGPRGYGVYTRRLAGDATQGSLHWALALADEAADGGQVALVGSHASNAWMLGVVRGGVGHLVLQRLVGDELVQDVVGDVLDVGAELELAGTHARVVDLALAASGGVLLALVATSDGALVACVARSDRGRAGDDRTPVAASPWARCRSRRPPCAGACAWRPRAAITRRS